MATEGRTTVAVASGQRTDRRHCSFFELPPDFFDFSCLVSPGTVAGAEKQSFLNSVVSLGASLTASKITDEEEVEETVDGDEGAETGIDSKEFALPSRLSCNTCKAEFDSLMDQRSHFKSDLHRLNVKLSHAGKNTVKEEDFDELTSDTFSRDFDVSSISGSEDEEDKASHPSNRVPEGSTQNLKQKLVISLQSGERVSLWKCFILKDSEDILYESEHSAFFNNGAHLREIDVVQRLKELVHEPQDNGLRVVLLARGGHFAGCVFDGNKVVAHKTFHRYVVRAKAGKKQSAKDGGGKSIHSAGASLRRYNELALKKDIQDLLASWKSYFDTSSCVFVQAPSSNRQLFFSAEKALVGNKHCDIRNIPSTVRRPTLKEAQRVYNQLSQVTYEVYEKETYSEEELVSDTVNIMSECPGYKDEVEVLNNSTHFEASSSIKAPGEQSVFEEIETEAICISTPLHEAAKSGDAIQVLELLEKGLDPTSKNERGKTPYMLADDKEVRNNFRRFMAANLDKWDWNAAKVPSALTKEMEESQAAKQAEKDAKRKAKAKELKKLRKAREKEKKEQAEAAAAVAQSQKESTVSRKRGELLLPAQRVKPQPAAVASVSKEEELRRKLVEDREKRAAAAERRIAAAAAVSSAPQGAGSTAPGGTSQHVIPDSTNEMACSCCKASMIGKVPFHRYNYKYCSTTCMHVHKEFLEDG